MTTILLIEDNDLIRENTAEILELTGYTVNTAENGKTGVASALAHRPDLVICDIMMPVLDGYGVLHIFTKNPLLTDIPFIFLSAKSERADFRKGMDLGADDYLTKPFEESELLTAIEGRLSRFRAVASIAPALTPDHPLQPDDLFQFLDDARKATNLPPPSPDRKVHAVRKKQFVYVKGNQPTRLYFIKSGTVKTVRANANGKQLITGVYHPGDFLGYVALLEGGDYPDSALAMSDAELVYIPKDEFLPLLLVNPQVSGQFIKLLAGRVSEREAQLLGMAYSSLRRRVADTLVHLHAQQPAGVIEFARDDLAAMAGTATESLIRTLSEFRHDGLLTITAAGGIQVTEPDKLRRANW